ncbi:Putative TrmH family tRNA/rRNA methyltransferase [Porphyromonas cangingivalis]|uniref:RNA 2-O ribose methyltransferase substrate binding domain-containing protein n=1 Tax=Porphyromonas cangingivalis TaxID=36874 RepID=A0A099X0S8_PORCN|nr:23S rRNA (guanosine(2251)-2'-O)-methyltransferase RlmB [Porphyromonas cangingivalis]KGL50040.1 hypothetical protein HQ34_01555 [Porphyromonas cangingivalis]KGN82962.1 hypothetical protein HQ35_01185 [Porphyromonas cangingivalis]SPY35340.1 Putative TrmH family tRNA/rRNA methyltransferase [Porphyromonas cangingivalis]
MKDNEMIFGIRAVIEALEAGEEIDKIFLKRESNSALMNELTTALGTRRVPIRRVPVEKLNRLTRKNHQGVIAYKAATTYYHLDQVIPALYEAGRDPFIVILDGITDVRNFGAIARTCECTGVDAIVVFEQNSVSVTGDAIKTSAGALSRIAVCRERSIEGAIGYLKDSGVRLVGATEKASGLHYDGNYKGPLALVLGAEDTGLSPASLTKCDELVRIPLFGDIGSLNVSVAAGVLIYEAIKQRRD